MESEGSEKKPREPHRPLMISELTLKETWGLDKLYSGLTLLTIVPKAVIFSAHRKAHSTEIVSLGCTLESPKEPKNVYAQALFSKRHS